MWQSAARQPWWACPGVPAVRASADRLQLLRQSPLSQVPGHRLGRWLETQAADLLEVPYFHVVFTLPSDLGPIALTIPAKFMAC